MGKNDTMMSVDSIIQWVDDRAAMGGMRPFWGPLETDIKRWCLERGDQAWKETTYGVGK